MSEDYSEYIFELGETPKRTYKGQRMRPLAGFELGMEVSKVLADIVSHADLSEIQNENKDLGLKNITLLSKCIAKIDVPVYMGFLNKIVSGTLIQSKVEGDTKTYILDNDKKINEWFAKYPKDLLKFSVQIIWENASPFLPEEFQSQQIDILKTQLK